MNTTWKTTRWLAGLILAIMALAAVQTFAQVVLGKHPADTALQKFYQQNGNADATIDGLNAYGTHPLAPKGGLTLGGVTMTSWPVSSSQSSGPTLWSSSDNAIYPSGSTGTNGGWVAMSGVLYPQ